MLLEEELCVPAELKIRIGGGRTAQQCRLRLLEKKIGIAGVFQLGREEGANEWTRKIWGRSWGC